MNKHRIVTFGLDDITVDPDQVAKYLTERCNKADSQLIVTGVCQTDKNVYFPLDDSPTRTPKRYVLAPMTSTNDDDIVADLYVRWRSGFVIRGLIQMETSYYGVFEENA